MTDLKEVPAVQRPSVAPIALSVVASAAVAFSAAYFLQHFPASMLALALVLIAVGRLAPIVREAWTRRSGNIFQACFDFTGVGLLALAALHGASGEFTGAWVALTRG